MPSYINVEKLKEYKASGISELTDWQQGWSDAIDTIMSEVPRVDVEPVRHGHWVFGKELSREYIGDVCVRINYDKCWCSECDYPVEEYPFWMYCPNCGAKMDKVTDNA